MPDLSLGIDFGTTTTLVSFRETGLLPKVLLIGQNVPSYMPSAIAFLPNPDGEAEVLVGEAALRAGKGAEVITSVKRCLHCDGRRCGWGGSSAHRTDPGKRVSANSVRCRDGLLEAGGRMWKPEELALRIIEEALRRASGCLERDYGDCSFDHLKGCSLNLGCSVAFDLDQRLLLAEMIRSLGFSRVTLSNVIEEPVAAGVGFAHLEGLRPGRTLIYDFGGGTFDAAVVDVDRDITQVAVLGSSGVAYLGGDDIDQMIVEYFLDQIGARHGLSRAGVEALLEPGLEERLLRQHAEETKIELSSDRESEVTIGLAAFGVEHLALSRPVLDAMLMQDRRFDGAPLFRRSEQCVAEVLRRAKAFDLRKENVRFDKGALLTLPFGDLVQGIDHVLLVGGVTKMPYVKAQLARLFGEGRLHEGYVLEDPVTAVAQGAALDKEYENLVLAAPPYSIVLEMDGTDDQPKLVTLYRAYDPLWPNRFSFSRSDIRFVSDTTWLDSRARVLLWPYDGREPKVLHTALPNQYLRVEIDLGAEISVLTGWTAATLSRVHAQMAPWQHRVQVVDRQEPKYVGLIGNTKTTMTEN